jgi:hypothetical protein
MTKKRGLIHGYEHSRFRTGGHMTFVILQELNEGEEWRLVG